METLWIVACHSEEWGDVKTFETLEEAKQGAIELAEDYGDEFVIYKAVPQWLATPPEEIPGTLTKIKK